MEASKCPKCGDEPHFVETVEKWYCYGCNSYIEDEEHHEAKTEHAAPSDEEHAMAIAAELRSLENEDAPVCKKCGAELEHVSDGKLFCYICETYPDEAKEEIKDDGKENEAQALLDSIPSPVIDQKPEVPVVEVQSQPVPAPAEIPEPRVEKLPEIKMCSTCGQPLKWIDKYQRHYCYGCRKYAPKEAVEKSEPAPKRDDPGHKDCPDCKGELKFIEKYNEYYCFACKKYPLRSKKSAPTRPEPGACSKCGGPLKHVEKYGRDYCFSCKEYAPKGNGHAAVEKKVCPACSSEMKFVAEYDEWYCYKCKKYSLRPAKPVLLF